MKTITRKGEITEEINRCIDCYNSNGLAGCVVEINDRILTAKVKFPLLEFVAATLHQSIHENDLVACCDSIANLKTIGGNVLVGIILQKRLTSHFRASIDHAARYIANADEWYVADIIGERVYGYALLTQPKKTLPEIKRLSNHQSHWVVRSLGAGSHYAIKKGLDKKYVLQTFKLLLEMAQSKDKHIRQGIGWAAKTTAKFHPEIISHYKDDIDNKVKVATWFRTKVKIGLERNKYASRNNS